MFWSGVTLTGNETAELVRSMNREFWSGVTLTGNEALPPTVRWWVQFWSSVTLIGVLSVLVHPHHAKAFLPGLLPYDSAGYERV